MQYIQRAHSLISSVHFLLRDSEQILKKVKSDIRTQLEVYTEPDKYYLITWSISGDPAEDKWVDVYASLAELDGPMEEEDGEKRHISEMTFYDKIDGENDDE